jgi:SAM-dependent methyltransferase
VARTCIGNGVYSASYYDDVERLEGDSVEHLAEWIVTTFMPDRIIDVGCGPGHLMSSLSKRGVDVFGVDISRESMQRVRAKNLRAVRFDLTDNSRPLPGGHYELAISCEVAEHLEERFSRVFVRHLVTAADVVFLTAAEPDVSLGPGLFHLNEKPRQYWIDLFAEEGYGYDADAAAAAAEYLSSRGVISYLAKPMIFRRHRHRVS